MADTPPTLVPLQLIQSETAGYCDPVTGMCTAPQAASTAPPSEAQPPDESDPEVADE
jgi:hypothetical protein